MSFSIYQLKPKFQQFLRPLLILLARRRVTPNQLTLLAILLSISYGTALALFSTQWQLWLGLPLIMFLRMALNALDGMLADYTGQKTSVGAVLNEIGDQVSDAALILPFALVIGVQPFLVMIVVIFALLAEFAGVLGFMSGPGRRFEGPMGKSDRAFAFAVMGVLVALEISPLWLNAGLCLIFLLLIWTLFNRLKPV